MATLVLGIITQAGQRGYISGFVDGNTMHYDWLCWLEISIVDIETHN